MQFNKTGEVINDNGYISERVEPVSVTANIAPINDPANYIKGRIVATAREENMVVLELENYGWVDHRYGPKRYMFINLDRIKE